MDFDQLPDVAFLRIFDFLPLKDRFRVGRVSQSFRRISLDVNSRIKSLDLDDLTFDMDKFETDMDQFEVILHLCHHNLREVKFCDYFASFPSIFAKFACPQLIDLDLAHNTITDDEIARIITNHPNLKSFKWTSNLYMEFPPVTLSNLETLHIHDINDETLESLIDRCPNLKNLEITLRDASSEDICDRFFLSVAPRLESLDLYLENCRIRMERLEWFWRLPLTALSIVSVYSPVQFKVNDDVVYKLVEHFKNIEFLVLWLIEASNGAVAALAGLEKLRVVQLHVTNTVFTDDTIRELSACRQLEQLYLYDSSPSDQTLLKLFRDCPRLRKLYVRGVHHDNGGGAIDAEAAGMLILELMNTPHRPTITIQIRCTSFQDGLELQSVWESIQVRNAVQYTRENHGMEIIVRLVDMPPPPPTAEGLVQGGEENGEEQVDAGQADGHQQAA